MNCDALGALAELVGALAVLLTLGYLAAQVRQHNHGMKVAAKVAIDKQFAEYTDLLLNNLEILDLQVKGMSGTDLSEIERVQYSLLMQRMTWHFSSMHYQYRTQALVEDDWYESDRLTRWATLSPGYRSWWEKNAVNFSPKFRDYLNGVHESSDTHLGSTAQKSL